MAPPTRPDVIEGPSTTSDVAQTASVFGQIERQPRLSDAVADRMLQEIMSGQLRTGDALPSERELGIQFGVSRTVVREAVRTLVTKGVLEVRSGRGLRVAQVDASAVMESMALFLRNHDTLDYRKVHEVRTMLEVHISQLAAERASEEDLRILDEECRKLEDASQDLETASRNDVAFHRAIARSTHNELYLVLLDSIDTALLDVRRATLQIPGRQRAALREHRQVLERILAGDSAGAGEAMRKHLERVERLRLESGE